MPRREIDDMSDHNIVDEHVEHYIRTLLPKSTGLLGELERYAVENLVPIVQPEIAQYLKVLMKVQKPVRILEIGTAIGYSATLMAEQMDRGVIETIELKMEMVEKASETFEKLKLYKPDVEIIQHHGDAISILEQMNGEFDMIFIDASKGHYKAFFELCMPMLKPRGLIVSDNVLYKGMVATNLYLVRRKITIVKRMRTYLDFISNHPELDTTVLPMGDGLAISYKKEADGA
ncbi:MAG: O-methyltransferase [Bacillota bacterium]|nr:O-methyltransferase [Bacillota bacterium]